MSNEDEQTVSVTRGEPDDNEIVAAILAGDAAQFAALVTRHTDRVYGLALHLLSNSEEAEDATQEAFIRAYAHLNTFHSSASFATWLYRIAINVCRDQLRRRQARGQTIELSRVAQLWADERYSVDPERVVMALEDRQVIEDALGRLPANYRATLVLHEVEGLTLNEVAVLMNAPLPTVKSRLQRARMALVTLLDETARAERLPRGGKHAPRRRSGVQEGGRA